MWAWAKLKWASNLAVPWFDRPGLAFSPLCRRVPAANRGCQARAGGDVCARIASQAGFWLAFGVGQSLTRSRRRTAVLFWDYLQTFGGELENWRLY
jgi:hypothetical protein